VPSFSSSLEESLHRAIEYANERHHEYATLEHLLLSLIDDRDASSVMRACNVDIERLRAKLTDFLDKELTNLILDQDSEAQPTASFQRVIHRAVVHVQSSGREEVTGANVLVAVFAERESNAAYFLQEQDMTRFDAVNFIRTASPNARGCPSPVACAALTRTLRQWKAPTTRSAAPTRSRLIASTLTRRRRTAASIR
jgi:ATP-dependent Clp protease ATP-binding subunit ClpA